ncbi:Oidioi.mRNA.OKI2018_I69.XSR.g15831.t1.cds [Oikopleura dioica]|uniref:Oidioi.mRNA.OKI2018_I69.XSR.g15831.t1.cds n=1 Tax=Oikopleura dioica TaxID=34765 RepID=A0ABN7SE41_OIKDI|nr:Oidioi.mRNA.OKI2018_I69.XSR.g15831.t1.cds [Oikopleura dioica]
MGKSKNKIFAAFKGREIGFFYEWDDCKEATSGFKGVKGVFFKGFNEKKEAEDFLTENAEQVATINDLPKENQYDKIGIVGKVKRTVRKNAQFDIGIVDQKLQLSVELEDYTGSIEVPVVDKAFEFIFDEEISEECLQEKKQLRKTLRPKTQMAKRRLKAFFGFICLRRRDFDGNYELYKFCAFEEFDDRLESICRQEEEEIEEENICGISERNPTDSEPIDNSDVIKRERSFLKRALEDDYSPQELPPPPKLPPLSFRDCVSNPPVFEEYTGDIGMIGVDPEELKKYEREPEERVLKSMMLK